MENKSKIKNEKAVTLVALVTTVIVLLILAGTAITIGINSGDLFGKADNGIGKWNTSVGKEDDAIREFEDIVNPAGGTVTPKPILATDKLVINLNGSTNEEKGPYVNYRWKEGEEPILCRVLYDKNDNYGVQIVAVNPVRKVTLGETDAMVTGSPYWRKALNSFNEAVQTLNSYSEEYIDTNDKSGIVKDARTIGSNPANKNSVSSTASYYLRDLNTYISARSSDDNYVTDEKRLNDIGASSFSNTQFGTSYWLGSLARGSLQSSGNLITMNARVRRITNTGETTESKIFYVANEYPGDYTESNGLRPVFTLNDYVVILSGKGTLGEPYEIGIK